MKFTEQMIGVIS